MLVRTHNYEIAVFSIIVMRLGKQNSYILVLLTGLNSMSTRCFHYFVTKSCTFGVFWLKSMNFWDFPLKQYCGNTTFFYTFFTKIINFWTPIYQSGIEYLLASKIPSLTHFNANLCDFSAVKQFWWFSKYRFWKGISQNCDFLSKSPKKPQKLEIPVNTKVLMFFLFWIYFLNAHISAKMI